MIEVIKAIAEALAELIGATMRGDAEAERQALLKAQRVTSDELARREAAAP